MIRCIFFMIFIINLVFCEREADLKKKLQSENEELRNLIKLLDSDSHSSRRSRGFGFNINGILKRFNKKKDDKENSKEAEELRYVNSDGKIVDDDYEDDLYSDDNDYELRQADTKIEDDYYEDDDDEDNSFLNDDDPRSDDPRHFLKKKFLMLKNLWTKKRLNSTLAANPSTSSTSNDVPTYVAYITLPASSIADPPASEPVENDDNINTGTPTGTGTGTGTITAQPADFVPDDLPNDSILPNEDETILPENNDSPNDPDKPDNVHNENGNNSEDNQSFVSSYGSRSKSDKGNKLKPNGIKEYEIIEEDGDEDDLNIPNENDSNDDLNNDEMNDNQNEEQQHISEQAEKHKIYLEQQNYIQQQIQKQLYEMQIQHDKHQRKRKRKRKKKIRPENLNEDDNAGISYYTKYLPPNLRKLMQIRPTVYLRGEAKNKGRKRTRILY